MWFKGHQARSRLESELMKRLARRRFLQQGIQKAPFLFGFDRRYARPFLM